MKYGLCALIAVMAMMTGSAFAEEKAACGDRAQLLAHLKDKYRESQTGFGMTEKGAVVELMTGENGSWTLILSFPSGHACLMATGEGWELWKRVAGKDA